MPGIASDKRHVLTAKHPLRTEAGDGEHQSIEQDRGLVSVARQVPKSRQRRQRRQDDREPRLSGYQRTDDRARSPRKPNSVLMTAKLGKLSRNVAVSSNGTFTAE